MKPHLGACILAALSLALSGPARAHIAVTVDIAPAQAVLAAIESSPGDAAAKAEGVVRLPAIRAMIAKEHNYNDKATDEAFRTALIDAANGRSDPVFQLDAVREDAGKIRDLLIGLQARRSEIEKRLNRRLGSFAPAQLSLQATLTVVLGSHQNGWVPDQHTPVFYLDAAFQHGDIDGLMVTGSHELFHVVQGAVQPDWNAYFVPRQGADAQEQALRNVHAALLNLVIEGMADYVGDPNAFEGSGPGITQARNYLAKNARRANDAFALFDTIIFRLTSDPRAPLDSLLSIGFGGTWDETGYYVGYSMARAIDRYRGRKRLQALVALTPEEFVSDYIAVTREHSEDHDLIPLADTTAEAVVRSRTQMKTRSSAP